MTLLGGSALWIAFLLGVWGAIAGFAGGRTGRPDLQRSARHAVFAANRFERLPYTPVDGRGMNPQLQNPGMVFHPPMLYLGYISITIPFAFAMAALLSKRLDADWLIAIRKWTLLSWLFLSVGICLGMWWAYVELGWGGYWAWTRWRMPPCSPGSR